MSCNGIIQAFFRWDLFCFPIVTLRDGLNFFDGSHKRCQDVQHRSKCSDMSNSQCSIVTSFSDRFTSTQHQKFDQSKSKASFLAGLMQATEFCYLPSHRHHNFASRVAVMFGKCRIQMSGSFYRSLLLLVMIPYMEYLANRSVCHRILFIPVDETNANQMRRSHPQVHEVGDGLLWRWRFESPLARCTGLVKAEGIKGRNLLRITASRRWTWKRDIPQCVVVGVSIQLPPQGNIKLPLPSPSLISCLCPLLSVASQRKENTLFREYWDRR